MSNYKNDFLHRFALDLTYYGISLNIGHLSGNLYLNYTLSSAVETLASLCILFLIFRLGRKPLYGGSMVVGATGFLLSALPIFLGSSDDKVSFFLFFSYLIFFLFIDPKTCDVQSNGKTFTFKGN